MRYKLWMRLPTGEYFCFLTEGDYNALAQEVGPRLAAYDAEGYLYLRSSKMTCAEAFFMASKAMRWAESGGRSET